MLFKNDKSYVDLSLELSDEIDWQAGTLRHVRHHLNVTALATEPVSGLLAAGFLSGQIVVYGSPGAECTLRLSDPPGARASFLSFAETLFRLLCVDDRYRLHIWDLSTLGKPKLLKVVHLPQTVK
ncbi:uncharacterized protein B0H18DRAFT_1112864 [Fomitopsis serialis]|uniref:uncharacterized protein n=1 Tax=Fomitopsis serialis TaxID=139415 RepID=UPI0020079C93|nr:uncharacterized protein B0H18DRAFT_1112864 [Neoantrodia serialis]KAH9936968.1 hypothetical protein B0H18DRAFT_1112864 [Neoantrodia serialis]